MIERTSFVYTRGRVVGRCSCGYQTRKGTQEEVDEQLVEHSKGHTRFNSKVKARETTRKPREGGDE